MTEPNRLRTVVIKHKALKKSLNYEYENRSSCFCDGYYKCGKREDSNVFFSRQCKIGRAAFTFVINSYKGKNPILFFQKNEMKFWVM